MSVTSLLYQTLTICALFTIRVAGDKVCDGTTNAETIPGGHRARYDFLRTMYTNCTHVATNLEIVYLRQNDEMASYDLSFLRSIKRVRGYVLISGIGVGIGVNTIPLNNLRIISGHNSYFDIHTNISAALAVINNPGIQRLHLARFREITKGHVLFKDNVNLKYVDRIDWRFIQGIPIRSNVHHINGYVYSGYTNGTLNCTEGRGWDDYPLMCQAGINNGCPRICRGRCNINYQEMCCSNNCAIACYLGKMHSYCAECRHYRFNDTCVESCPMSNMLWPNCTMPNAT